MKPPRPETLRRERMDDPDLPLPEVERALADIGRVHRFTGREALTKALAGRLRDGAWLLDVGTGTGTVPERLARDLGLGTLTVIGVDNQLRHLAIGRRQGFRQHRVVASADALPFADDAVDWSTSTLFLHHFDTAECRRALAEMARVARCGVAASDLRRSWLGSTLARLLFRVLRLGPVARYDGGVSIDQAWTLEEIAELLGPFRIVELRRRWPFRFSLVAIPLSAPGPAPPAADRSRPPRAPR